MVGLRRVMGSARALYSGSRALFWAAAVGTAIANCSPSPSISVGDGFGADSGEVGIPTAGSAAVCQASMTSTPVFAEEMFRGPLAGALDLYVWVPASDVVSLRADKKLFDSTLNVSSSAPLSTLSSLSFADPTGPAFATSLQSEFQSGRYAWPQPWANRMLQSDPSAELVHVTLRPEAWLAVIQANTIVVYDATRTRVAFADAFAHPERIGAIYFDTSLTACSSGGGAERGFLIGNEALVQEWSLGTPEILARLQKDIQDLSQFLIETRSCPTSVDQGSWSQSTPCEWQAIFVDAATPLPLGSGGAPGDPDAGMSGAGAELAGAAGADDGSASGGSGGVGVSAGGGVASNFAGGSATPSSSGTDAGTELGGDDAGDFSSALALQNGTEEYAYMAALAEASSDYFPQPAQIGAIIDTLQGDVFEPDPLIVSPGSP